MKKFKKVFFISFASLFVMLIVAISILLWLVFTPERLTPIIRKQADKYLTCKSDIGEVELTFFSTFPHFGLKVNHFALINPMAGAPNDTLVMADQLVGVVDAAAWWKNKELILTGISISNGTIHAFTDSVGNSNYAIVAPDTTPATDPETEPVFGLIEINSIVLDKVSLYYTDLSAGIKAVLNNLTSMITGTVYNDSIRCMVRVDKSGISFEHGGEQYLKDASVRLGFSADLIQSRQFFRIKNASFSVNDMEILINGTVENDTINRKIHTDLSYKFNSWPVKNMLALVPPAYHSYLEGIEADGLLSSHGTITGIYGDSVMPLMDIHLQLEKGSMGYADFTLPLHDIAAIATFHSDMKTDSLSYIRIDQFNASTPKSFVRAKGFVNHLFTDVYCQMTMDAGLTLEEFNPMLPDSLNTVLKGNVNGRIRSDFSLSMIQKMELEKMKLSGSLTLAGLDVTYDSIWVKADRSTIEFALPNLSATTKKTGFASAAITSGNLEAGKPESYQALMKNAFITLETSDLRDTTRIPDIICSFATDFVQAAMDTMRFSAVKPNGKIFISPGLVKSDQPAIRLSWNSGKLETTIGQNSAVINTVSLDGDIVNDNTQQDLFQQWLIKGFIDLDQGTITMPALSYAIEIPAIRMNFEPETFTIKESSIKIGKSDFQLSGNLNNVLSYFRGDSILRGNFNFVSATTDVSQLMSLTSGIGNENGENAEKINGSPEDTAYTGPYMVPMGIDVQLRVDIAKATSGIDTATNIRGNVRVNDGILLLDEIKFSTPAARMQLTSMYRTPRKNHLYLGLDYHMLDIEIGELLTMIPDIDTLMPMLRSFGGKGEFHIAVETYLDSLYNIKKSTLRGASSIKGNDLILMDGESFSEIAKTLKFNKKTENRVDTLSAEFTIFRDEIDIYPFLIVMDKYKAVVGGRHNFDLSFDYHISLVDSPLPIKLGVDIKGNMDNMAYSLAKCRYAEFYRPVSRRVVENKQLELRKMIREALTQKVKE